MMYMSAQEEEVAGGGGAGGGGEDGHLLGQEHDLLTVPHEGKLQGRTPTKNIYLLYISIYLYTIYLSRVLAWAGAGVTRTC